MGILPADYVYADESSYVSSELSHVSERTIKFNDDWLFCLEPSGNLEEIEYDDSSWKAMTLPYDWSLSGQ